ncbi:hypothetical protein PF005_g24003 [Phytophthora fragariae]|uniref:Uncharacterized protein n=2 Tax=Phytophthora TaxID=4783 RepID=A0A6A3W4I2_9STRA|nr:hypothetical protein PF009_g26082 [Phytophthora fragariae]KAE9037771.1 hypothetical protein PR002_g6374 [Phytophthora rubi]KAE8979583.1 hypothetical protein PF011_g22786 [Phytophthora fragariae]KAE9042373.1 hypothetical protein PR001_g6224 [Phytophthora rubi]KAE9074692.1 hypothetical protein PF007_g25308 [Phytophthora fragariae]
MLVSFVSVSWLGLVRFVRLLERLDFNNSESNTSRSGETYMYFCNVPSIVTCEATDL